MYFPIANLYNTIEDHENLTSYTIHHIIKGCNELGLGGDLCDLFNNRDLVIKHVSIEVPEIEGDLNDLFSIPDVQEYLNDECVTEGGDEDDHPCEDRVVTMNPMFTFLMVGTFVFSGASFIILASTFNII